MANLQSAFLCSVCLVDGTRRIEARVCVTHEHHHAGEREMKEHHNPSGLSIFWGWHFVLTPRVKTLVTSPASPDLETFDMLIICFLSAFIWIKNTRQRCCIKTLMIYSHSRPSKSICCCFCLRNMGSYDSRAVVQVLKSGYIYENEMKVIIHVMFSEMSIQQNGHRCARVGLQDRDEDGVWCQSLSRAILICEWVHRELAQRGIFMLMAQYRFNIKVCQTSSKKKATTLSLYCRDAQTSARGDHSPPCHVKK